MKTSGVCSIFTFFSKTVLHFESRRGWQTFLRFTFFTYRLNLVLSYRILSTTRFHIILTPLICVNWFHPYVILIKMPVISCSSFCLSFLWTLLDFEMKNSCLKSSVTKMSFEWSFHLFFNSPVPNAPFLYLLKTSENCKVLWRFLGVEKGCIGNEWVG